MITNVALSSDELNLLLKIADWISKKVLNAGSSSLLKDPHLLENQSTEWMKLVGLDGLPRNNVKATFYTEANGNNFCIYGLGRTSGGHHLDLVCIPEKRDFFPHVHNAYAQNGALGVPAQFLLFSGDVDIFIADVLHPRVRIEDDSLVQWVSYKPNDPPLLIPVSSMTAHGFRIREETLFISAQHGEILPESGKPLNTSECPPWITEAFKRELGPR